MIYLILALTVGLCGITIAASILARHSQRRLSEQMRLVVQSQHAALSQAQTSDKKLDWIRYEQQQSKEMQEHHFHENSKALDHQRKSLEHQRVMLASLNRQMQDLDDAYNAPKAPPAETKAPKSVAGQAQTSLRPHPAAIRKNLEDRKPVSLSQLFSAKQQSEQPAGINSSRSQQNQSGGRGALIKSRDAAELGLRRVANG